LEKLIIHNSSTTEQFHNNYISNYFYSNVNNSIKHFFQLQIVKKNISFNNHFFHNTINPIAIGSKSVRKNCFLEQKSSGTNILLNYRYFPISYCSGLSIVYIINGLTRHSPPSRLAVTGSVGESTRSRCLHHVVVVGDKIDWSL